MIGPNYMLATSSLRVSSGKSAVVDGMKTGSSGESRGVLVERIEGGW